MSKSESRDTGLRYEFRVWGHHDEIRRRLSRLADVEREQQQFDDCYLLVAENDCNIKIRRNRLKVKRFVEERYGFESWATDWHKVPEETPASFERLLTEMVAKNAKRRDLAPALAAILDDVEPDDRVRAVFVSKERRRFRVGSVRAEAAVVKIGGRPGRLKSVAIEGVDLGELRQVRSSLGLGHLPSQAVHFALAAQRRR